MANLFHIIDMYLVLLTDTNMGKYSNADNFLIFLNISTQVENCNYP